MIWSQILVVLLSVILGLFLIAGIALIAMVVKVTIEIKSVSRDTRRAIDNIEQSVSEITKTAKVLTTLQAVYRKFKPKSNSKKERTRHDK
ncbi:MAG: hypothetical protein L0H36_00150 [bacterium]|nr:hypothetical protein [bacterium]MDN5835028.1 hypothetical protein [bacterium]